MNDLNKKIFCSNHTSNPYEFFCDDVNYIYVINVLKLIKNIILK